MTESIAKSQKSDFIPPDLEINGWDDLKPYFDELSGVKLSSAGDLENFLIRYSEVLSVFFEANAWAYINMTCHTDNTDFQARHDIFVEKISPEVEKATNAIDKKIAGCPVFGELPLERYTQFKQKLERDLALFRDENVPLAAEVAKLSSQYDQLTGGLTATIDGEELPLPRATAKLQSPDRELRKKAWLAIWSARYAAKPKADDLYDAMRKIRQQMALNAGYDNFRDFQHDRLQRFDYTPQDAETFSAAVEEFVVPLAREIDKRHRDRLGLAEDDYRPWDSQGQPEGQEPLKPFETGTELLAGAKQIFAKVRPEFGENLQAMDDAGLFDLDSHIGKAPGGYNYPLEVTGMPFIFMNAAGTQRDLVTMMHEGGHAMHTFLTNAEPLVHYRSAPSEMAETASMGMELLTSHLWSQFYSNPADFKRARREHLEGIISFFPWCATVDSFQHWVYLNPNHTQEERDDFFENLTGRFASNLINWTGYEKYRRNLWQAQLHIFGLPFYYIEYGIAQLGALQVYRNYRKNAHTGLEGYIRGLSLGSSLALPEVWNEMGIKFDFSAKTIRELMQFVQQELDALEEN